jgi:hypothetical protein
MYEPERGHGADRGPTERPPVDWAERFGRDIVPFIFIAIFVAVLLYLGATGH